MPVDFELMRVAWSESMREPKHKDPYKKRSHGMSTFTRTPKAGCPKRRGRRGRR